MKTDIYTRYENGKQWKREEGHYRDFPNWENYLAGNQWPKATSKTKDLPRPVLNILKRILSFKVSSTMKQPLKARFTPQEIATITKVQSEMKLIKIGNVLGSYIETLKDRLDEEKRDEIILTRAGTVGACFAHTFWDNEIVRGNGEDEAKGEICREFIDSLNVYFDMPTEEDPQKQERIRIVQNKSISWLKQYAKECGLSQEEIDSIRPDEIDESEEYEAARNENYNSKTAEFITEYWKRRVWVTDEEEAKEDYDEDAEDMEATEDMPDADMSLSKDDEDDYTNGRWKTLVSWSKATKTVVFKEDVEMEGHTLIPISSMIWERRNSSAYGTSEIGHLIPNQKAINFLIAMMLLSAQNTGWPALVVDDKAVKTNPVNKPGAIHRVNTEKTGGNVANAMRHLETGNFSNQIFSVLETLINYTKDFSGANEVALGEASTDLSGLAINRLQNASAVPLETVRRNFRDYKKQNARIDAEFFVHNYTKRKLSYKDKEGNQVVFDFSPEEIENARFDIGIDIGTDTEYSAELSEASLKGLLDQGQIDLMQYLKYADPKVVPFAKDMLEELKKLQEGELQAGFNDQIAEVIIQMQELEPEQLAQFMAQDMDTIMAQLGQIMGGGQDEQMPAV